MLSYVRFYNVNSLQMFEEHIHSNSKPQIFLLELPQFPP